MDHLIQNKHTLVIEAGKTELHYWRDLWHFRELLYFLAWRDVIVRYKQTVIGIAWALQSFIGIMALSKYLEGKDFDE